MAEVPDASAHTRGSAAAQWAAGNSQTLDLLRELASLSAQVLADAHEDADLFREQQPEDNQA